MPTTDETTIHPTAAISEDATIEPGAYVGPRCTIEGPVTIKTGARLLGNCHIVGDTIIGSGTTVYPFACIGFGPQHVKIKHGDPTGGVTIGEDCTIREQTSIHAAMHENERTIIGDRLYLMATAHIGHDSIISDDVVICNGSQIAGHCEIHDRAYVSGNVCVHQFCRVGTGAMLSGGNVSSLDVPPYSTLVAMNTLGGLNLVGMRRAGIPREQITIAREAFRKCFRVRHTRDEQIRMLEEFATKSGPVRLMVEFVRTTKRGVSLGDGRPRPHTMQWFRSEDARRTLAGETIADIADDSDNDGLA